MDISQEKSVLRSFGFMMTIVFSIVAGILLYKEKMTAFAVFSGIAGLFFFLALVQPSFLAGVYARWMKFADVIGRFNAKLILTIIYTTVFTLLRIALFISKKDLLHKTFDSSIDSYWHDHESLGSGPERYEKQF